MGNDIYLRKARFAIPIARTVEATKAVAPLHAEIGYSEGLDASLDVIFANIAWPLTRDGKNLKMIAESDDRGVRVGWLEPLFERIAPFVVDRSYVKADGEGGPFEWYFRWGDLFDEEPRVTVVDVKLSVAVGQLRSAHAELQAKRPTLMSKLDEPVSLTVVFDRLGWRTRRAGDGGLVVLSKADSTLTSRDEQVLESIARYVVPDSSIQIEDHESALLVFRNGNLSRTT